MLQPAAPPCVKPTLTCVNFTPAGTDVPVDHHENLLALELLICDRSPFSSHIKDIQFPVIL